LSISLAEKQAAYPILLSITLTTIKIDPSKVLVMPPATTIDTKAIFIQNCYTKC
ncbi:23073_t:CDS:1, partial [Gigaspora margarita]